MTTLTRERLQQRMGGLDVLAAMNGLRRDGTMVPFAEFLFDDDRQVCRRAAWVLTKADDKELMALLPLQQRLIDRALHTDDSSLCRLILNLLERMPMDVETMRTDLLDFCLDHMMTPGNPPGVQSLCMKIAHRMCSAYPELAAEFRMALENMEDVYYTPGVISLRRKLLGRQAAQR